MPRRQVLASPSRSGRWRGLRGGEFRRSRTILRFLFGLSYAHIERQTIKCDHTERKTDLAESSDIHRNIGSVSNSMSVVQNRHFFCGLICGPSKEAILACPLRLHGMTDSG